MKKIFTTTEISDSEFEQDYLRFITVKSDNLKGRGNVCVFVPPGIDPTKSYPVSIFLHGVYGSSWILPFKSGIHRQALNMIREDKLPPMIIAMPSDGLWGDGSAYLPHNGKNFEKWIVKDLPALLKQNISGVTEDSALFISGLSMGGWGALRFGAKYPHIFQAAAGHSSITNIDQMKLFVEEDLQNYRQADKKDEDIYAAIIGKQNNLPPLYFDCGKSDLLIAYNQKLHEKLSNKNIKHTFRKYEGGHEWAYWKQNLKNSLLFFSDYIGSS